MLYLAFRGNVSCDAVPECSDCPKVSTVPATLRTYTVFMVSRGLLWTHWALSDKDTSLQGLCQASSLALVCRGSLVETFFTLAAAHFCWAPLADAGLRQSQVQVHPDPGGSSPYASRTKCVHPRCIQSVCIQPQVHPGPTVSCLGSALVHLY